MEDNNQEYRPESDEWQLPENAAVIVDGSYGVYVPQRFAQLSAPGSNSKGYTKKLHQELLEGPDYEWYWEAWDTVLNQAIFYVPSMGMSGGMWCALYQDGDLFLVPIPDYFDHPPVPGEPVPDLPKDYAVWSLEEIWNLRERLTFMRHLHQSGRLNEGAA